MSELMGLSREELLADIEHAQKPPMPEDGWLTTQEWARHWDCHINTARKTIKALLEAERMIRDQRPQTNIIGVEYTTPVFKLVEEER